VRSTGSITVWVAAATERHASALIAALPGDIARRIGSTNGRSAVALESRRFVEIDTDGRLEEYLKDLLGGLNALVSVLEPDWRSEFAVLEIVRVDAAGKRSTRRTFRFAVVDPEALARALEPVGDGRARIAALRELSEKDASVVHALSLIRNRPLDWAAVYDVIELLTKQKAVNPKSRELVRHRRTAAFYRHSGNPRPSTLPSDPPAIEESRAYVLGLLRSWLESKL
jgi:Arc/MetJ family transcription regulator